MRITVRTAEPDEARAIALRVINQRRGQGWPVVEVEVQDAQGHPVKLFVSERPHPASLLREG